MFLYLCKIFKIKRISKDLANSIYSKSFFSRLLMKRNLPYISFITKQKYESIKKFNQYVIKPDAPIIGKKNVYLIQKKFNLNLKLFNKIINSSHNKKIICSDFIHGLDIGNFVFISKTKKKIRFFRPFYEKNKFEKNKIYSYGLVECKEKKINEKIYNMTKKIVKLFPDYYGFLSITYRITNLGKIFPYEINIGLSGDGFVENYLPSLNYKFNPYDYEINNLCL